jgi:peptidoglycan/xylan/chitin deacetylase (PgdA/CDA1 family)/glycosyltransferase involved in cell wall biosynthesis
MNVPVAEPNCPCVTNKRTAGRLLSGRAAVAFVAGNRMQPRSRGRNSPRFSVVIPTYQRREVVLRTVCALNRQEFDGDFEVIVVVDGSCDGSADALRQIDARFQLTILEQPNQGAASARNQGVAVARGEILLFLDDDMEAHPSLLAEHDRSHQEGADVVLGHIPLHPESPSGILTRGVKSWADHRAERLATVGEKLTLHDLLTGQLSLTRAVFYSIGGFDTNFTHRGSFGNEDVDFGYRLLLGGYKILFNTKAVSWQYYVVEPRQYLRQWRQAGRADVYFVRNHPEQASLIFALNGGETWMDRYVWRRVAALPVLNWLLAGILRWLVFTLTDLGRQDAITARLLYAAKSLEYWNGVREAGGVPRVRTVRVLAYHAIADLAGASVLEPYAVPPDVFRRQLDTLQRAGFTFVNADEFLRFLQGRSGLPRRALLLTFDDCYQDLLDVVSPILKERRIPAIAFAVSGLSGSTNVWDEAIGAPRLRLLNEEGLRKLAAGGVEIGAHSRSHRPLTSSSSDELSEEIAGSIDDLEKIGLKRPRLFAYPYGDWDERVQQAIQKADLQAAFTVDRDLVRSGQCPYSVPRIEILRQDVGWKFLWKLATAGCSRLFSTNGRSLVQEVYHP